MARGGGQQVGLFMWKLAARRQGGEGVSRVTSYTAPTPPLLSQSAYKSDIDNDVAIASNPKFVQNPISLARESFNPQKFG